MAAELLILVNGDDVVSVGILLNGMGILTPLIDHEFIGGKERHFVRDVGG